MTRSQWLLLLGVAVAIAATGGAIVLTGNWMKAKNAEKYLPLLNAAERKYGIPTNLLARQSYQESRFRDDIVSGQKKSSAGALGLMQIVPKWHPGVDPLNVAAAIDYAAKLLSDHKRKFGSWSLALAAYNAGPGNVAKYKGIPPFKETQDYVAQITGDVVDKSNPSSVAMYA